MTRRGYDPADFGQAVDDDYRGFEIGEEETARGPLILALALGVLIVFAAVVWNTYRQGVREEGGKVPVVAAEAEPFKLRPAEAGGHVVPDIHRRIFDEFEQAPADSDDMLLGEDVRVAEVHKVPPSELGQGGPPLELHPGAAADSDPATGMPNALADQVRALAELEARADEPGEIEVAALADPRPARTPEPVLIPDPPSPSASERFGFSPDGLFMVQVAAFRSRDAAETAWQRALATKPALYGGAAKDIQRAELGARGVFYRLRAGAFASRGEARAFCEALKAAGDECIVVQR